jgi:hypothetical protein
MLHGEEVSMETATLEMLAELERRLVDRAFLYDDPQAFRDGVGEALRELRLELSDAGRQTA